MTYTLEATFKYRERLPICMEKTNEFSTNEFSLLEYYQGCIVGGAIGDALGMPAEGMTKEVIIKNFKRIKSYLSPIDGSRAANIGLKAGQYTDDTQLSIALLNSIILKECVDIDDIARHFAELYKSGGLRLAGFATQKALKNLTKNIKWEESGIKGATAAGNGPSTRVAPIALFSRFRDLRELSDYIFYYPIITHNNIKAVEGTAVIIYTIDGLVGDSDYFSKTSVDKFIDKLIGICNYFNRESKKKEEDSMRIKLLNLKDLLKEKDEIAQEKLKTSGYMLDTVQSALYYFLKTPNNFEETVLNAVNGGGDTDSIASIAGSISGAFLGVKKIPNKFKVGLENHNRLMELSKRLYEVSTRGYEEVVVMKR